MLEKHVYRKNELYLSCARQNKGKKYKAFSMQDI